MAVYIGGLWHEGCDPFLGVIARSRKQAEVALDEAVQEEFERNLDSDCECDHAEHTEEACGAEDCECVVDDTIRTGGVFRERSIRDYVESGQVSEVIDALRKREVAYT